MQSFKCALKLNIIPKDLTGIKKLQQILQVCIECERVLCKYCYQKKTTYIVQHFPLEIYDSNFINMW